MQCVLGCIFNTMNHTNAKEQNTNKCVFLPCSVFFFCVRIFMQTVEKILFG